ncbi:hypothetical protein ABZ297_29580 [Nonomuraea sp. NPDC005983]|uniref:hypothetical protein n=1 Tax=Nonomuraea sp. NPDC005983 TaxID=3155595 RepID=UPI0033A1F69C
MRLFAGPILLRLLDRLSYLRLLGFVELIGACGMYTCTAVMAAMGGAARLRSGPLGPRHRRPPHHSPLRDSFASAIR